MLVGLIGTGQEINLGEEAGLLGQWREALQKAGSPEQWTAHASQRVLDEFFADPSLLASVAAGEALDLTVELRFHFAADLDEWVDGLLAGGGTLLVGLEQCRRGGISECRNVGLQKMFLMIGGGEHVGSGADQIRSG